jgi:DNA-binding beta-propeller fold protein YncE
MNIFIEQELRFASPYRVDQLLVSNAGAGLNKVMLVNKGGTVMAGSVFGRNFNQPEAIAYDEPHQQCYVVDRRNGCVKVFGETMEFVRGFGLGLLNQPVGIALDGNRVYVADNENHRVAVFDREGVLVETIGSGYGPGHGQMFCPCGVAIYKNVLIVAEWGNGRVQLFDKTSGKSMLVREGFLHAHDVKVDAHGRVYVAVYFAKQVRMFDIKEILEDVVVAAEGDDEVVQLEVPPMSLVFGDTAAELPWIVTKTKLIKGAFDKS